MAVAGVAVSVVGGAYGASQSRKAARQQGQAAQRGIGLQQEVYDQARADNAPYMQAGSSGLDMLMRGLGDGTNGDLTRRFSMADFEKDPGYDFRMQEGARGVESGAAARGGLLSGAAAKALTRYNQNFASNEYGQADARYARDQNQRYGRLLGVTGIGQQAVGMVGNAGQNYGNNVTGLLTGQGNAQAAGTVGSANAMIGGASGAFNNWQQNQLMQQLQGGGNNNGGAAPAVGGSGGMESAPIYDANGNLVQAPIYGAQRGQRSPWTVG